jgi:hypothetical protein
VPGALSPEWIYTDSKKLKFVQDWLTPKNKHETGRFLGQCTYCRQLISGFAYVSEPLAKLSEQK